MGMFDHVIVDINILPDITEEEKKLLASIENFQTKSFENKLTDVYIVEDKDAKFRHSFTGKPFHYKIQIKEFEFESVPESERPDPENLLFGCIRETNVKIVDSKHTGSFSFYTYLGNVNNYDDQTYQWVEFIGEAENGKIISIKRLTE